MFDTIKGIIGDIAAGAIKDQRVALSREELTALDAKLREALSENENLSQRVTELEGLCSPRLHPALLRLSAMSPGIVHVALPRLIEQP